ncbi:hypothetical protein FOA52_015270 [Chlamydomonas sp. UWO 241]|nr:hypothetical protein FOA52_015270 [Chlamydomonas sp. UWO 241]
MGRDPSDSGRKRRAQTSCVGANGGGASGSGRPATLTAEHEHHIQRERRSAAVAAAGRITQQTQATSGRADSNPDYEAEENERGGGAAASDGGSDDARSSDDEEEADDSGDDDFIGRPNTAAKAAGRAARAGLAKRSTAHANVPQPGRHASAVGAGARDGPPGVLRVGPCAAGPNAAPGGSGSLVAAARERSGNVASTSRGAAPQGPLAAAQGQQRQQGQQQRVGCGGGRGTGDASAARPSGRTPGTTAAKPLPAPPADLTNFGFLSELRTAQRRGILSQSEYDAVRLVTIEHIRGHSAVEGWNADLRTAQRRGLLTQLWKSR